MVQKLTLEDEISQRRCRAQHTIDLICTLRKRVEQLVERYNQHTSSSSENSVKLLTLLLTELKENAEEAVASAAQNILESEGHLLPALCQDPGKLILSAIEQLRTSDLEDLVSENFSAQDYCSIHDVYRVIRRAVKNLKTQVALSPDEVMKHFTEGKSRYRIDHELSLSLFREDCDNHKEDRKCLDEQYLSNRAVQIWLRNDMNVCKTICEMDQMGCEESELSGLFAYIVRVEILHEIAKEAKGLIAVPCVQASVPASSAHPDPIAALISYLQPLQLYINPLLKAQASDILTQLLSDSDVAGWIFSGKGHKGDFNKTKVFKLARMLRVHHFYLDNFLDKDLDQILEHSDSDTNFRKNMNKEYHNDLVIEKHLKRIIEPLLKKS